MRTLAPQLGPLPDGFPIARALSNASRHLFTCCNNITAANETWGSSVSIVGLTQECPLLPFRLRSSFPYLTSFAFPMLPRQNSEAPVSPRSTPRPTTGTPNCWRRRAKNAPSASTLLAATGLMMIPAPRAVIGIDRMSNITPIRQQRRRDVHLLPGLVAC